MAEIDRLKEIVQTLRSDHGCPWDREQTHESLKPACMEEAAEVISGINILSETGDPENLKEELGDLLLQVMFHAVLAEEEDLFTFDDVAKALEFDDERMKKVIENIAEIKSMLPALVKDALAFFPGVDRSIGGYEGLRDAQSRLDTDSKKDSFAEAIVNEQIVISDESWNNFRPIIDIIQRIIEQ